MAKGTHGGRREGAGRPPAPVETSDNPELRTDDPIAFLRALMRDSSVDIKLRADAAKRLAAYERGKKNAGGKKGERAAAAEEVAQGQRFAPLEPPRRAN